MRILSLVNVELDKTLGSGKIVIAWTSGLLSLGHDLTIITPTSYHKPLISNIFRRLKIRLDTLSLKKMALSGKYDIIEFYGAEFGPLINHLASVPRVYRPLLVHHSNGCELLMHKYEKSKNSTRRTVDILKPIKAAQNYMLSKWNAASFKRVDCFATICQSDVGYLSRTFSVPPERCAVIEPGIDNFYLDSDWNRDKQQWIVSLGTWIDRKGISTIVKVVSFLFSKYPNLEYHAIGAEDSKSVILASFDSIYHRRIIIHPQQPCLSDILTQAKVILFPSLYESFGLATIEALACGCNVVATPTGFAATIKDGVDGFVCPFDDHELMIRKCRMILDDQDLSLQLRNAGRQRVAPMSWSNQVSELNSTYKRWVSEY